MIAFTYFREINKIRLGRWITQGLDIPTRMVYQLLISIMASEGARGNTFNPSQGKMRHCLLSLTEHTYYYGSIMPNKTGIQRWSVSSLETASNCSIARVDIVPLQKTLVRSLLGLGMKRARLGDCSRQCHFIRWHSFL